MKKFFTLIAAIAMATTLSMPAFAAKKHKKHHTTTQTKKHMKHAKKKGAKEGQKKGQ
jgi:fatty-acid desaturase